MEEMRVEAGTGIEDKRWQAIVKKFDDFSSLARESKDRDESLEEVRKAFDEFRQSVNDYKRSTDPAPQRREDAGNLENKALTILDEAEWANVTHFAQRNSNQFEQIAQRAKRYLEGDDRLPGEKRKHRQEAEKMIRRAMVDRWWELYRAVYERTRSVENVKTLMEAEKKAGELLAWDKKERSGPLKGFVPEDQQYQARKTQVENWLKWLNNSFNARNEIELFIKVDNREVADREIWGKVTYDDGTAAPVRLSNEGKENPNGETPWFSGEETVFAKLPAIDFTKQSRSLKVEVTIDNWFTYGDTSGSVEFELPWAFFPRGDTVKQFEFPGWDGQASVKIECQQLTPPVLYKPE